MGVRRASGLVSARRARKPQPLPHCWPPCTTSSVWLFLSYSLFYDCPVPSLPSAPSSVPLLTDCAPRSSSHTPGTVLPQGLCICCLFLWKASPHHHYALLHKPSSCSGLSSDGISLERPSQVTSFNITPSCLFSIALHHCYLIYL